MLDSLEPGSRVLLNSGIFGTIRARGEQQLVIELAPGVEVTVLKQTVVRTANPDEEEFEYAEDQIAAAPVDSFVADSLEQAPATPVEGELTTGEDAPADAAQTEPAEQPSDTILPARRQRHLPARFERGQRHRRRRRASAGTLTGARLSGIIFTIHKYIQGLNAR